MHKKQPSDSKASIRVFYREKSLATLFYVRVLFIFQFAYCEYHCTSINC